MKNKRDSMWHHVEHSRNKQTNKYTHNRYTKNRISIFSCMCVCIWNVHFHASKYITCSFVLSKIPYASFLFSIVDFSISCHRDFVNSLQYIAKSTFVYASLVYNCTLYISTWKTNFAFSSWCSFFIYEKCATHTECLW